MDWRPGPGARALRPQTASGSQHIRVPIHEPVAVTQHLQRGRAGAAVLASPGGQVRLLELRPQAVAEASGGPEPGESVLHVEHLDGVLFGQEFGAVEFEELDLLEPAQ